MEGLRYPRFFSLLPAKMPSSLNIVIYVGVGLACITVYRAFKSRKYPPYPPGPKPLPVVGNAHHMPTEKEWVAFADMAKTYGK